MKLHPNPVVRRAPQQGAAVLLTSIILSLGLLIMALRTYKETISNTQLTESAIKLEQASVFEQAAQNLVASFDSAPSSIGKLMNKGQVFNGNCIPYSQELSKPLGQIDKLIPPLFKSTDGQAYEIEVYATVAPVTNCVAFQQVSNNIPGRLRDTHPLLSDSVEDGSTVTRRKYMITSKLGCKEADNSGNGGGSGGNSGNGSSNNSGNGNGGGAAGTPGSNSQLNMTKSDKERNCITRTSYVWNDR